HEKIALAAQCSGHPGDRVLDRPADSHLLISRMQPRRGSHTRRHDELTRPQREVVLAVAVFVGDRLVLARMADVQAVERRHAPPARPCDLDFGAEYQERRCEIPAEGGETDAAALRRDVADVARRLEAMVDRAAPPAALVVEDAARIET